MPQALEAAEDLKWDPAGLMPAIVQDGKSGAVRMLGWMNREALARTRATGEVHVYSRSRKTLWRKGETSGNTLRLISISTDCDRDALVVRAVPAGPTCHTGAISCFFRPVAENDGPAPSPAGSTLRSTVRSGAGLGEALDQLVQTIARRSIERPKGSYTAKLLRAGVPRVAQKVGEEAVETALAAAIAEDEAVVGETVDLLYHLLVLLEARGIPPSRVAAELTRRAKSG